MSEKFFQVLNFSRGKNYQGILARGVYIKEVGKFNKEMAI